MWLADSQISLNYTNAVRSASADERCFQTFKSNPHYTSVVGMSQPWQAQVWMENIKHNHPDFYEKLKIFSENDKYGSPQLWRSGDGFVISPNTLRFVNTLIEIESWFGFGNHPIRIAELGVGYGGLSFILNSYYNVVSYSLLDLPEVYNLTDKYLKQLGVHTHTDSFFENTDLFVSEWCLSEFDDDDILRFYEKYMVNSKNVYLQMNLHEETRKNRFLELMANDFEYCIRDEYPKTQWDNYVILGKNKKFI
jgi:putative sugar O-methyltransferase